jgi:hypothetical protein
MEKDTAQACVRHAYAGGGRGGSGKGGGGEAGIVPITVAVA